MRLTIVGTGYVGLVAGAGFAEFGNDVTCVDLSVERIEGLRRGEIPFHEPGLKELVLRNVEHERLSFTTNLVDAVPGSDVIMLAVGTPSSDTGAADLSAVMLAAKQIGQALTGFAVITNKSTVPVGTADKVAAVIAGETKHEFAVASNPEFLKEGDAVNDFLKPSRIILGVDDDRARGILRRLYAPFVRTNDRVQVMDVRSAELAKYASNAMLATRISFMNELALLAEAIGADIEPVRRAVGADPRIGRKFLFPGVGFGGSCFPKDLRALINTGNEAGIELGVVSAVEAANRRQKKVLFKKLGKHFEGKLSGLNVCVWGLAFKPKTDDIREAPALELIRDLVDAGAVVTGYDPVATDNARAELGDIISYADNMYTAAENADALMMVTEWPEFRRPNFKRLIGTMKQAVLFDGRNVWSPDELRELGFAYYGIGRL